MKKLFILIVLIIVIIAAGALWWKNGVAPANISDNTSQIFVVSKGEGVREIASSLKKKGLIKDPIIFFILTKRMGLDKEIQAGDFRLNPSMDMYTVIQILRHGTLDIWTTIPEGLRATEIAQILKDKMPTYQDSWASELKKNEGYLFPDTYLIPRDTNINMIIAMFKNNFDKKYSTLDTSKTILSQTEIITIASLIEREARRDEDRSLVASVIINRLKLGMKLDIDATIQYAIGYQDDQKKWWKKSLTASDKLINSPYNTYKVAGLPPTPISNPGLSSIQAAINPAKTPYLYYMTDKNGVNRYSEDLEGHNANIQKYGL